MKYLETNTYNPYYNLAFEEYILNHYKDDDYLLLWQNDNTIVVGMHQNTFEEVNIQEADKSDVNIVRRITGGGAVYHDLGNLNFSYITDWNNGENINYERFLKPIVNAFEEIGLHIEIKGRNDLLLEGKKISGSAQALVKDRILHHGTLLVNSNLETMVELLNVSPDKIQSKGVKSVMSRVTNIQKHVRDQLTIEDVKSLLLKHWSKTAEIDRAQLNGNDFFEIESMENNKYRTWKWNFGRSPKFNYTNKKRFSGGAVEVNLDVEDGIIKDCMINGDFLSLKSVRFVEENLVGEKYDFSVIKALIDKLPMRLYFGDITAEELTGCFFV